MEEPFCLYLCVLLKIDLKKKSCVYAFYTRITRVFKTATPNRMQREDRKKKIVKVNKKIRSLGRELSRLQEEAKSTEKLKSKQDVRAFIHNAGTWKLPIRRPNLQIGWPDASDSYLSQREKDKKRAREQAAVAETEDLSYHEVFHIEELRLMILDHMGPMELAMIHATNKKLQQAVILSFPALFDFWMERLEAPLIKSTKQTFQKTSSLLRTIKERYANCPPLILPHLHSVFVCYRSYGPLHATAPHQFRAADPPVDNAFVIVHDKKAKSFRPSTEYGHFKAKDYGGISQKRSSSFYTKQGFFVAAHEIHNYLRYKDYSAMEIEPISHYGNGGEKNASTLVVVSGEEIVTAKDDNRLAYHQLISNESLQARAIAFVPALVPFLDLYECRREIGHSTGKHNVIHRYGVASRPSSVVQMLKLNESLAKLC